MLVHSCTLGLIQRFNCDHSKDLAWRQRSPFWVGKTCLVYCSTTLNIQWSNGMILYFGRIFLYGWSCISGDIYSDPCRLLTKVSMVRQKCMFASVKDWNLTHYLNLFINCQRLSLPLLNTHPMWFSLTNELWFADKCYQTHSFSLTNLFLLNIKLSFISVGQPCLHFSLEFEKRKPIMGKKGNMCGCKIRSVTRSTS